MRYVYLVSIQFLYDIVTQPVERTLVPVVHVAPCENEVQDFATLIVDEVKLEAVELAHRPLSPLGIPLEHFVALDQLVVTYGHSYAFDETYARALAKTAEQEEEYHLNGHP